MSKNNTITRIIVSVIAIPLILMLCIWGGVAFMSLVAVLGALACYEFDRFTANKGISVQLLTSIAGTAAIVVNAYVHFLDFQILILILVLAVMGVELFRNNGSAIMNAGATLLGMLYIGLGMSTLVEIREFFPLIYYRQGAYMVIAILASIWLCDSAAFFGGITFGKHRLMERVSPKKSWEGAIFGFVFSVIAMLAARYILLDSLRISDAVILGVLVGTVGQVGDLAESLLKRDAGVKDSSNLIPGHGGIFDRFDSLIAVSPAVYVYLKLFVS